MNLKPMTDLEIEGIARDAIVLKRSATLMVRSISARKTAGQELLPQRSGIPSALLNLL